MGVFCEKAMKKRFRLIVIIALGLAIIIGGMIVTRRQAQTGLSEIKRRGVLRVGLDAGFPPFELLDEAGQVVGLDADIARAVAADLGVDVEFANIGFDGLTDALKVGRVDAVISGLAIDPLLTRDVAYSSPYFNAGQVLITTRAEVQSLDDLAGQTVAVEWGSMADMEARRLRKTAPSLQIAPMPDAASALRADLAIVDGVTLLARPAVRRVAWLTDVWYAVAVRLQDRALLAEVNRTLTRLRADAGAACPLRLPPSGAYHPPEVDACYAR